MNLALAILVRRIHLASVIVLIGGVTHAGEISPRFRQAYWIIGAILLAGVCDFVQKRTVSAHYNVWLGIKVLLALHIFAVVTFHRGKQRLLTGYLQVRS